MKNFYTKFINHLKENMPVYVMIFVMFLAFCSRLNVQFDNLKHFLRCIIKVVCFIAFVCTTVYLFYDVITTVEGENGIIKQNNTLINELEAKKLRILNEDMPDAAKINVVRSMEKNYTKTLTDKEFDFFMAKFDEANRQQIQLRGQNIESWKWKIGTLIALNAFFISIAKFF
jgi:hypothetical protein